VALTVVGALLLASLGRMNTSKHPNTDSLCEPDEANALDHLKVESLIIAKLSLKAQRPQLMMA